MKTNRSLNPPMAGRDLNILYAVTFIICLTCAMNARAAESATIARGVVYEDRNQNNVRDDGARVSESRFRYCSLVAGGVSSSLLAQGMRNVSGASGPGSR